MSRVKKATKDDNGKAIPTIQLPIDVNSILALDLSLNATGYCRHRLDSGETDYGVIESNGKRGIECLDAIVGRVRGLLGENPETGKPVCKLNTLVVIENYAFARANQAHQLGELHGVVRYELWKLGFPYVLIAPMQNKKWITGQGNSDKNLVLKELMKRYGFDVNDDNIADAIGLMTLIKAVLGKWEHPLVAFQKEVVSKVLEATAS